LKTPVSLYLRVRSANGGWTYARAVIAKNRQIRPLFAVVGGQPTHCPEGVYHLRYRLGGKRIWEPVGSSASLAQVALQRKALEFQADALGIPIAATPAMPTAPTALATHPPTISDGPPKRRLTECVTSYLAETKDHKSKRTSAAYMKTLGLFAEAVKREHIEDITREDILEFKSYLAKRGNEPRTVRNRIDFFQIFLHHFGLPSLLKGKDLPKYTKKKVRAYNEIELGKMFSHACEDETDLLQFLLCTGVREQEAKYACWCDVDLVTKIYKVTEHLDLGFTPKDKEEGKSRSRITLPPS